MTGTRATHVAFAVPSAFTADVQGVLDRAGNGAPLRLDEALGAWWSRRNERLAAATSELEEGNRRDLELAFAVEPSLLELLSRAPRTVRSVALSRLQQLAPRLLQLVQLRAPEVVLAAQRRACREQLDTLDPNSAWQTEPAPAFDDLGPSALHAWLDAMLKAAQADAPNVGLDDFGATPEAVRFLMRADEARTPGDDVGWQGFAQTTMAVDADPEFWIAPRVQLSTELAVATVASRRWVVAEASGPVSYAARTDPLPARLAAELVERVRALPEAETLLSFVWLETASAGPWRPY